jgi:predicted alpha-1,2-mannosidase
MRFGVDGICSTQETPFKGILMRCSGIRLAELTSFLALTVFGLMATAQPHEKDPVSYVDPNIGGIGQLLTPTLPYVQRAHGMARVVPTTPAQVKDRYLADHLTGFEVGPLSLMIRGQRSTKGPSGPWLSVDHDRESATPYLYSLISDDAGIQSEVTTTDRDAFFRFSSQGGDLQSVLVSLPLRSEIKIIDSTHIQGYADVLPDIAAQINAKQTVDGFFSIHLSEPLDGAEIPCKEPSEIHGKGRRIRTCELHFKANHLAHLELQVGLSYISSDQAHANLDHEIGPRSFDKVSQESRAAWNSALQKVQVTGGSERERRIFYTALYRSLLRMTDITEDGKYFSGFDYAVHPAEGHEFYVDDGIWDTYRSLHPLQLLIEPKVQQDVIWSYLQMYHQSGWLPSFPSIAGERAVMLGHHAAAMITDAYMKGYRGFDAEAALEAMKKNATEATLLPWRRGPATSLDQVYFTKGYFPALEKGETESVAEVHPFERRQAVSVTLETSYDDWCLATLAQALGHKEEATQFFARAHNYENVFNPEIGFMAGRTASGKWVDGFDPKLGGGQGGRAFFAEVNSWVDTFHVQHDPAGLIRLMGGRDAFVKRLDVLFQEPYGTSEYGFLDQFPDMTGLIGLYPQGNEPAFHIPYLYIFAGQPWKTQQRLREIMDLEYDDTPKGIPGDEDGGAMSSWYVLNALGFYPECPGSPVYEIGSPIFQKSVIALGDGKTFTILSPDASKSNKYIQSAELNGAPLTKAWFEHAAIANGGTLTLHMGPSPNTAWGAGPDDAPPSMSR